MVLDFGPNAMNLPFGDDIPAAQQDYLIGDGVYFVQDMARNDDVHSLFRKRAKKRDRFGAHQRVETVQRLVEHEYGGPVRYGLCQLDTLAHAFAIAGDLAMRGVS